MPRLLVHLTEDQRRRLRRAAEAEDTSMAEVVRRAVELYLRLTPGPVRAGAPGRRQVRGRRARCLRRARLLP